VVILITSFLAVNAVENIPHVSHVVDVVGRAEVVDVVETLLTLIPMLSLWSVEGPRHTSTKRKVPGSSTAVRADWDHALAGARHRRTTSYISAW